VQSTNTPKCEHGQEEIGSKERYTFLAITACNRAAFFQKVTVIEVLTHSHSASGSRPELQNRR